MTIEHFISELFCRIDDAMQTVPKHPQASLWPNEVVTLGLVFALKGVGTWPLYRWVVRAYRALFLWLPERTRLFRLFKIHRAWTTPFLAAPTVLGVINTC
jgi:hypothetical protein